MKYISLSFDDARGDFYTKAFPIIKKYNLTATLNVITDFVLSPESYIDLLPCGAMSRSQVKECFDYGIEIACHGHKHVSEALDLLENIEILRKFGVTGRLGFASPNSELTWNNKNSKGVWDLCKTDVISYVRSGYQVRREGIFYTLIAVLDKLFHFPYLYKQLHEGAVMKDHKERFLPSATVFSYTTNKQLEHFIDSMPDESSVILMFHSILSKDDKFYGSDKWYWDIDNFDKLLEWLDSKSDVKVCTTIDMVNNRL